MTMISGDPGKWNDDPCEATGHATMCEKILPTKCDTQTYKKANGANACGLFVGNGLTWFTANDICKSLGARLPVISTAQENLEISTIAVKGFIF